VDAYLRSSDEEAALKEAGYGKAWTAKRVMGEKSVRTFFENDKKAGVTDTAGKPEVADKTEVAAYFSNVMRGTKTEKEQLKAAELLGKLCGMFNTQDVQMDEKVEFVGDERLEN